MRPWTAVPRPLLYLLAALFCAATTLYACFWMYDSHRLAHPVELGFNLGRDTVFNPDTQCIAVYNVAPGSPAERAGLRPGDAIIGLNGEPVTSYQQFDSIWSRSSPGDHVKLTIFRAGQSAPLILDGVFQATRLGLPAEGFASAAAKEIIRLFPVLFLIVGFAVLFLRIEDPYAWLLALLFTGFIASPEITNPGAYANWVQNLAGIFRAVFAGMVSAMVYYFFAIFPEKSPLERRAPWLKWVAMLYAICRIVTELPASVSHWTPWLSWYQRSRYALYMRITVPYLLVGLGFLSLFLTSINRQGSLDARRKARVLLWGTLLGVLPVISERFAADFWRFSAPFWLRTLVTLTVVVYPLSFAYAIVRYRVLEIPALLRRSARYVLVQRGFFMLLLLSAFLAIFFFSRFFSGVPTMPGSSCRTLRRRHAPSAIATSSRRFSMGISRKRFIPNLWSFMQPAPMACSTPLAGKFPPVSSRSNQTRLYCRNWRRMAGRGMCLLQILGMPWRISPMCRSPRSVSCRSSGMPRTLSGLSYSASLFRKSLTPARTSACWIPWPARRPLHSKTFAWPNISPTAWRSSGAPRTKSKSPATSNRACFPKSCRRWPRSTIRGPASRRGRSAVITTTFSISAHRNV